MTITHLPGSYIPIFPVLYTLGTIFWITLIILVLLVIGGFVIEWFDKRAGHVGKRLERDLLRVFPGNKRLERRRWLEDMIGVLEGEVEVVEEAGGKDKEEGQRKEKAG